MKKKIISAALSMQIGETIIGLYQEKGDMAVIGYIQQLKSNDFERAVPQIMRNEGLDTATKILTIESVLRGASSKRGGYNIGPLLVEIRKIAWPMNKMIARYLEICRSNMIGQNIYRVNNKDFERIKKWLVEMLEDWEKESGYTADDMKKFIRESVCGLKGDEKQVKKIEEMPQNKIRKYMNVINSLYCPFIELSLYKKLKEKDWKDKEGYQGRINDLTYDGSTKNYMWAYFLVGMRKDLSSPDHKRDNKALKWVENALKSYAKEGKLCHKWQSAIEGSKTKSKEEKEDRLSTILEILTLDASMFGCLLVTLQSEVLMNVLPNVLRGGIRSQKSLELKEKIIRCVYSNPEMQKIVGEDFIFSYAIYILKHRPTDEMFIKLTEIINYMPKDKSKIGVSLGTLINLLRDRGFGAQALGLARTCLEACETYPDKYKGKSLREGYKLKNRIVFDITDPEQIKKFKITQITDYESVKAYFEIKCIDIALEDNQLEEATYRMMNYKGSDTPDINLLRGILTLKLEAMGIRAEREVVDESGIHNFFNVNDLFAQLSAVEVLPDRLIIKKLYESGNEEGAWMYMMWVIQNQSHKETVIYGNVLHHSIRMKFNIKTAIALMKISDLRLQTLVREKNIKGKTPLDLYLEQIKPDDRDPEDIALLSPKAEETPAATPVSVVPPASARDTLEGSGTEPSGSEPKKRVKLKTRPAPKIEAAKEVEEEELPSMPPVTTEERVMLEAGASGRKLMRALSQLGLTVSTKSGGGHFTVKADKHRAGVRLWVPHGKDDRLPKGTKSEFERRLTALLSREKREAEESSSEDEG